MLNITNEFWQVLVAKHLTYRQVFTRVIPVVINYSLDQGSNREFGHLAMLNERL
jgi:hypothetical protein